MQIFKFFCNYDFRKEPPFRNPYEYLKEEALIKLQREKKEKEARALKEKIIAEKLMTKRIGDALEHLNYAANSKRQSNRKKRFRQKREDLCKLFSSDNNSSTTEKAQNERANNKYTIGKLSQRCNFLASYKSTNSVNTCNTSPGTKDSLTSISSKSTNATSMPGADYTQVLNGNKFATSTSSFDSNSYTPINENDAFKEFDKSTNILDHSPQSTRSNNFLGIDLSYLNVSMSLLDPTPELRDISIKPNHNTAKHKIQSIPDTKTTQISEVSPVKNHVNFQSLRGSTICIDSSSIDSSDMTTLLSTEAKIATNKQNTDNYYHANGSIALPRANCIGKLLSSFRKRYHRDSLIPAEFDPLDIGDFSLCSSDDFDINPENFKDEARKSLLEKLPEKTPILHTN